MRADSAEEKFEFFKWDFPVDFDYFPEEFSAIFLWVYRAEVGTQTKIQLCIKMQRFGENIHF